mmetsp:Transcript_66693/g.210986  ORF Transcript_66693/g.210986 Transcript_66693/m.210986 type:complete len:242 (-) Transcript_66693:25-750(-)
MACHFATQCCCGCTLSFGVKAILIVNLLRNVVTLGVMLMNVVFESHTLALSSSSLAAQTVLAMYCLAGLPLIFGGLWGVYNKAEAPLRLFFYYFAVSLVLDLAFIVDSLIIQNPCLKLAGLIQRRGQAFACGAARGMNLFATFTMLGISFYLAFIVLSYCEDLALAGGGPNLTDLAHTGEVRKRKTRMDEIVGDACHLFTEEQDHYGSVLDQAAMEGGGASMPIFGTFHNMQYHPAGHRAM